MATSQDDQPQTATAAVKQLYAAINSCDSASVAEFLAEDCIYEDLHIFPEPMRGRQEVMNFINKFFETCGSHLHFVIDGITENDPTNVGLMWHMEHKGEHFPLSKGCSFYRLENRNGKLQVVYGRDIIEPPVKHGTAGLDAIRAVLDKAC